MPRDNNIRSNQATAGRDETAQHRDGDRKGWVRHHSKGPLGQTQVAGVGSHNLYVEVDEAVPQHARPVWVKLHRDDPSSLLDKGSRQRTSPCADVDYKVAWAYPSVGHNLFGPTPIELVPPPACPYHGHGEPSRTSS